MALEFPEKFGLAALIERQDILLFAYYNANKQEAAGSRYSAAGDAQTQTGKKIPGIFPGATASNILQVRIQQPIRRLSQDNAIRNLADGRIYLRSSMNVDVAMNRDQFELKQKGHRNKDLLQDWIRLGADSFRFEVIDTLKMCDDPDVDCKSELAALLAMWVEELDCGGARG